MSVCAACHSSCSTPKAESERCTALLARPANLKRHRTSTTPSYRIASHTLPAHTPFPVCRFVVSSLRSACSPSFAANTAAPCCISACKSCQSVCPITSNFSSPSRPVFSNDLPSLSLATPKPIHRWPFDSVQLLAIRVSRPALVVAVERSRVHCASFRRLHQLVRTPSTISLLVPLAS